MKVVGQESKRERFDAIRLGDVFSLNEIVHIKTGLAHEKYNAFNTKTNRAVTISGSPAVQLHRNAALILDLDYEEDGHES